MYNELYLEEWVIESIRDNEYESGNKLKGMSIKGKGVGTSVSLYEKDIMMLQKILGCNEDQLKGKNITAVIKEFIVKAIGYQGLYIPLYYSDDNLKLLSESELCTLLDTFDVVRINKNGEQVASYEVPAKNFEKGRSK